MSNELIRQRHSGEMMTAADSAAAIDFALKMGKVFQFAGVGGCKTEQDGQVLALACMMRGVDPFELTARHHIIGGKLAKKADVMLADFNQRGGSHRWLNDGNDGTEASLELKTKAGATLVSTFSLKDATDAGLVKSGTRWTKGPRAIGSMLRARCTSEGIRMLDPAVSAGVYTPEELDDTSEPAATEPAATRRPRRTKEQIEADAMAETSQPTTSATPATREPGDDPIDAEFTHSTEGPEPPFDTPPRPPEPEPVILQPVATVSPVATTQPAGTVEHTAVLMEISEVIRQMGATMDQLNETVRAKASKYPSLQSLTPEQIKTATIDNLSLADAKVTLDTLQKSLAAMKAAKK